MKQIILFFLSLSIVISLVAQKKYQPKGGQYGGKKNKYRSSSSHLKRNKTDVFPLEPEFNLNGWFGSIGGTYMIPWKDGVGSSSETFQDSLTSLSQNSSYTGSPSGKLGFYIDLGYFHSFQEPLWGLFHFYEVGLSYRMYKGSEDFSGSITTEFDSNNISTTNTEYHDYSYSYTDQAASLVAKISNHWHFSRYGFIQNSLGINVDYFFSQSRSGTQSFPGYEPKFPEQFQSQLSYRLGVGWKAAPRILIIPSLELPLITLYPFDDFKSALPYFSTRQYPIIFSIRVMILRKLSEDCRVPNYDGPANFQ